MTVEPDIPHIGFLAKRSDITHAQGLQQLGRWATIAGLQIAEIRISAGGKVGFEINLSSEDPKVFELYDWRLRPRA